MSKLIGRAIEIVKQSGVSYEVGPMETVMEGKSLDELMTIVKKAHDECLVMGVAQVFINVKILSNPSGLMSIHDKTRKHR